MVAGMSFLCSAQTIQVQNGKGFPGWLLWVLLAVIVVLAAFILIRDRSLRNKLKNFFKAIGRKFRLMRLRSRLKREQGKVAALFTQVGRKILEARLIPAGNEEMLKALEVLDQETRQNQAEIDRLNSEIEGYRKQYEEYHQKQQALIKQQREEKKPHEQALSQNQAKFRQTESTISQNEKKITYADKQRAELELQLSRIESDAALTPEIKKSKGDEIQAKLKGLGAEVQQAQQELPLLKTEKEKLEKAVSENKQSVALFDQKIKELEYEDKKQKNDMEGQIKKLEPKKKELLQKNNDLTKKMEPQLESLGKAAYAQRVAAENVSALYSQIGDSEKKCSDWQQQITSLQGEAGKK